MIYEKNQLMLTGVVAMSPVVTGKSEYNTNRKVKFAISSNNCSIITREEGSTQYCQKTSEPWTAQELD
jgi:hypothetical protein